MKWICCVFGLVGLVFLVACGGTSTNTGVGFSQTLSFTVNMGEALEAHVVLHKADGSVIEAKTVTGNDRSVNFTNVPLDAQVTGLVTSFDDWFDDISGEREVFRRYEARTYPASYVADRTFFLGSFGSVRAEVSGDCPAGSSEDTEIRVYTREFSWFFARCESNGEGGFSFTAFPTIWEDAVQSDEKVSLILYTEDPDAGLTHYATLLDQSVNDLYEGVALSPDAWKTDFASHTLSINFPESLRNQPAFASQFIGGQRKNKGLRLEVSSSGETNGLVATNTQLFAPVEVDEYYRTASFGVDEFDEATSKQTEFSTNRYQAFKSLPNNDVLTVGSDLWSLASTVEWSGTTSPKVSYSYTGSEPKAANAFLTSEDFETNEVKRWTFFASGSNGLSGGFTFPQLPNNLAKFVPQKDQDYSRAFFRLTEVALGETIPDAFNYVTGEITIRNALEIQGIDTSHMNNENALIHIR